MYHGYYKVQQLYPSTTSSKNHTVSLGSLSSFQMAGGTITKKRLPTVLEHSEFEVLALTFDSESISKGGPIFDSSFVQAGNEMGSANGGSKI